MDRTLNILLVEDDEEDAFLIRNMLSQGDWTFAPNIKHVDSCQEAKGVLEQERFDIALFDYRLQDMNGIELLQWVRERNIPLPVVFLTGQSDPEVAAQAIKAGATDYRSKNNLTAESLIRSIEVTIQLRREEVLREQAEEALKRANDRLLDTNRELKGSLEKLRVAQDSVIRSEKLASIGRLAAMVGHEVLNPLNIISGHVQTLQREFSENPKILKPLQSIREEIYRIDKILSDLLRFSRSGNAEFQEVDLNEELDFVLSIVEKGMRLHCIEIQRLFTEEPVLVYVDPDRMRQVFLNLFNNAMHAMPGGGVLTIRTDLAVREIRRNRRKEDALREPHEIPVHRQAQFRIRVTDTGTGIKKEHMDKIFDPFFTTKPEGKGTGLGMSVCYAIVDQHGGLIEVESEEGKGTTVQVWLPVVSKEAIQSSDPGSSRDRLPHSIRKENPAK